MKLISVCVLSLLRASSLSLSLSLCLSVCLSLSSTVDLYVGLWTIIGILTFIILEKLVNCISGSDDETDVDGDDVENESENNSKHDNKTKETGSLKLESKFKCYSASCRSNGGQLAQCRCLLGKERERKKQ